MGSIRKIRIAGGCALMLAILPGCINIPKTELRHCVDFSGYVQPDQVCHRGQEGYRWVYGGRPDPNDRNRMADYTLEPSAGSSVVGSNNR